MRLRKIHNIFRKIHEGTSLSRKEKKWYLGRRLSRAKIKKLIRSVKIIQNEYPQEDTILPYSFCPQCGCQQEIHNDHGVGYPERWVTIYCARCGYEVGGSDNSPYWHCLSFVKDGIYDEKNVVC